jgi:hypothetical protein
LHTGLPNIGFNGHWENFQSLFIEKPYLKMAHLETMWQATV